METLQTTISHIGETAPYKKPITDEKKQKSIDSRTDESNYVDLNKLVDVKSDGTKTVKVTFTGEGNQLAIFKCQSDTSTVGDGSPGKRKEKGNISETPSKDCHQDHSKDARLGQRDSVNSSPTNDDELSNADMPTTETDPQTELILQDYNPQNVSCESEELHYTDMYLNSQSESEDGSSSVVLSDQCTLNTYADESHYITTHEIQLTELDHDVDYEIGRGPCWDYEDTNLVYSFVDYASFESDETTEGTLILDGRIGKTKITKAHSVKAGQCGTGGTAVSTESDVCECDSDKCASSDESVCKNPNGGESAGKIHLSIKTSSRNINESNNFPQNENICYRARNAGERGQYFFRGSDSSREAVFDRAHYFIPAPGRQHLAPQLKGKDMNEYSSGASSSISELDDADKEVRNLTAKSFRSLACPYFDAINLSTSSESSMSEHGIGFNKWSAFVDLNYGNMTQAREKRLISHRSSTFEVNKNAQCKTINGVANIKTPQTKTCSHNNNKQSRSNIQKESSATKKIEIRGQYDNQGQGEMITLTETLNFRCNVEAGQPTHKRRAKCVENTAGSRSADEVTSIMPSRPGSEAANPHIDCSDTMEDTHKKAIFASSLLKNVISKKMQFEQERKMERGEIRDTHPAQSPCFQTKDADISKDSPQCKVLQRQTSETDSGLVAVNELGEVVDTSSNIDPMEQLGQCGTVSTADLTPESPPNDVAHKSNKDICERKKMSLGQSQNSAFKSWKDGEENVEARNDTEENITERSPPTPEVLKQESQSVSGKSTKMSHLYVPSSQLLSKDKECEQQTQSKNTPDAVMEQGEGERKDHNSRNPCVMESSAASQTKKAPEIKIRLRSVKENKNNPFNIASLLTPKIGFSSTYPPKLASESKYPPSEKVPHFTVRDIRETKGKFQTPIHQVRDVRKLVKSSYRFVSLENTENKAATPASLFREDKVGILKKEPDKKSSQSPMVIKCHSVNTNNICKPCTEAPKRGQIECTTESDRLSPKQTSDCIKNESVFASRSTGRTPCVKMPYGDQTESKLETKAAKQRQDKTIESMEKKSESKVTNQAALEKLKAAVKTMEQLYVFDRNEWKRKTQAPRPVTDSHVLSLITSEEQGGPAKPETEDDLVKGTENDRAGSSIRNPSGLGSTLQTAVAQTTEDKVNLKPSTSYQEDISTTKTSTVHGERFNNKCVFNFGSSLKTPVSSGPAKICVRQTCSVPQGASTSKSIAPKFQKAPLSLKITAPKRDAEDKGVAKRAESPFQAQPIKPAPAETENYLTIPVKACTTDTLTSSAPSSASGKPGPSMASGQLGTSSHSQQQPLQRSPIIMESWAPDSPTSTTIYHHSLPIPFTPAGPQVLCISPSLVPTVTEPIKQQQQQQQTQKKMLLDPTTGHYYLVDTPVQPATKRLYDPETGQYVDVPVPPPQPLTPVPMPISPLALSPGAAFAPTYMIYPGLMASPTAFTTRSLSSSTQSEGDGERTQGKDTQVRVGAGVSSPSGARPPDHSQVGGGISGGPGGKPVISITTQQGPRIIAPPSFDGTTMSFVVEHR